MTSAPWGTATQAGGTNALKAGGLKAGIPAILLDMGKGFLPVYLALFIAVVVRSFFQTATGTAMWKERMLDRVAMRWL